MSDPKLWWDAILSFGAWLPIIVAAPFVALALDELYERAKRRWGGIPFIARGGRHRDRRRREDERQGRKEARIGVEPMVRSASAAGRRRRDARSRQRVLPPTPMRSPLGPQVWE